MTLNSLDKEVTYSVSNLTTEEKIKLHGLLVTEYPNIYGFSTEEYFNDRFDKERMPSRNVGYVRFVEVSFKGPHWECRTLTWEPTEDYVPFPKDALTDGKQFVHNNKKIVVV